MPEFNAQTVFADPTYNAGPALAAWPDTVKRKGDWRADWAPWIDHGIASGLLVCLPFRLMGHLDVFDTADGQDQRKARATGRFVIGGDGPRPVLFLAIDQGRRRGLAGTNYFEGSQYDSYYPEDRERNGSGWIAVQFAKHGLPVICVGFYFHKPREKPGAINKAQTFLGALGG